MDNMKPRELIEESGARPDIKAVGVLLDIRELLNKQNTLLAQLTKAIGKKQASA